MRLLNVTPLKHLNILIVDSNGGGNIYQLLLVPWKNIIPSRSYR